jgi:hypothetical protein
MGAKLTVSSPVICAVDPQRAHCGEPRFQISGREPYLDSIEVEGSLPAATWVERPAKAVNEEVLEEVMDVPCAGARRDIEGAPEIAGEYGMTAERLAQVSREQL